MDVAGPALLSLARRMLLATQSLSVSPTSPVARVFAEDLAFLGGALIESGGRTGTILEVAEGFEQAVATYSSWQSAEVGRTVEAMTQMLKVIAESLKESVQELEDAELDLEALSFALTKAEQAQSIEEIRAALDGQQHRVQKLSEIQARQRQRHQKRLESTIATLETELATVLKESLTDPLTSALNRTGFESQLAEAKLRLHESDYSLAILDLDGFKSLNDSLGHVAGDVALKAFFEALAEAFPSRASIARFGGDEFVVLTPQDSVTLRTALTRFRAKLPKRKIVAESPRGAVSMHLAASFGVTDLTPTDTAETAIARADEELYAMKRQFAPDRSA